MSMTFWLLLFLLCISCYTDISHRKLPNWLCFSIFALGFLTLLIQHLDNEIEIVSMRIFYVLVVLSIGCVIHKLGLLGGGDIKLVTALSIWFEQEYLVYFLILFTILGGFIAVLVLLYNQIIVLAFTRLVELKKITTLPYGVAISTSAVLLLL